VTTAVVRIDDTVRRAVAAGPADADAAALLETMAHATDRPHQEDPG
jgi:hypothetical protein